VTNDIALLTHVLIRLLRRLEEDHAKQMVKENDASAFYGELAKSLEWPQPAPIAREPEVVEGDFGT